MMVKIILLLNPVYVTLFWTIVLTSQNRKQHVPKRFLGRFMFVAFALYLSHLLYFTGHYSIYYYLDSIYTLASLLVYPLYHIYVRLLTTDNWFSMRVHGKYLVLPLLVFTLHLTGYLIMDKEQALHYLTTVLSGNANGTGITWYMQQVYLLFRIVFILQVFFYLYLNYRLISIHNNRLEDFYSNLEDRNLDWVQFFNFSLAATSLASAAVAILGRDMFANNDLYLAFPSIIFSVLLFLIGMLGNLQGEVKTEEPGIQDIIVSVDLTSDQPPLQSVSEGNESLSGKNTQTSAENSYLDNLREKMDELFTEKMIFRNPDLKIWDVCNMLGTNRTYVSKIINNHYDMNFCNHVNFHRVDYAKKLLDRNNRLTNEEVAELSGFGSTNSLYRAFHTFENRSLGDYRRS